MAHPNEDLVREGYAAFGRGDVEALQSHFFAPDIRWHFPVQSPFAGDYSGLAEVLGGSAGMWECLLLTSGAAPLAAAGPLRWVPSLGGYRLEGSHLPAQDPSEAGR